MTASSQISLKKREKYVYLSTGLDFPDGKRNNNGKHGRILDLATAQGSFGSTMNAGLLKPTATNVNLEI